MEMPFFFCPAWLSFSIFSGFLHLTSFPRLPIIPLSLSLPSPPPPPSLSLSLSLSLLLSLLLSLSLSPPSPPSLSLSPPPPPPPPLSLSPLPLLPPSPSSPPSLSLSLPPPLPPLSLPPLPPPLSLSPSPPPPPPLSLPPPPPPPSLSLHVFLAILRYYLYAAWERKRRSNPMWNLKISLFLFFSFLILCFYWNGWRPKAFCKILTIFKNRHSNGNI